MKKSEIISAQLRIMEWSGLLNTSSLASNVSRWCQYQALRCLKQTFEKNFNGGVSSGTAIRQLQNEGPVVKLRRIAENKKTA